MQLYETFDHRVLVQFNQPGTVPGYDRQIAIIYCTDQMMSVGNTERSDHGEIHRMSKHHSNSTTTIAGTGKTTSVSWADIVKRSAYGTTATEREANMKTRNGVFREIILSKQSSDKERV